MKQILKDFGIHILLIILVFELAALFVQNFQPENLTLVSTLMNGLIGYIITNFVFKNDKIAEKVKEKLKGKKPEPPEAD